MTATQLIHYSIRTADLERSRRFYCEVLGLHEGFRPAFDFDGAWLYAGGDEDRYGVVHLIAADEAAQAYLGARQDIASAHTGALDHLAFQGSGLQSLRQRLQRNEIDFRERTVPGLGLHQVFFQDPSGLTIEMNFAAAEAAAA